MSKPPPSPFDERRAHRRVELLAQVQVSRTDEVHILSTVNISSGGVFLSANPESLPQFQVGIEAELVIAPPNDLGESVTARARLVRIEGRARPGQPAGFGFEFSQVDPLNKSRLKRLTT